MRAADTVVGESSLALDQTLSVANVLKLQHDVEQKMCIHATDKQYSCNEHRTTTQHTPYIRSIRKTTTFAGTKQMCASI